MAELIIARFEVDELTAPALDILKAAVTHAKTRAGIRRHTMPIEVFCRLAGLPSLSCEEFSILLKEARRALVIVEALDTLSPNRDDLPYSSWPVFSEVMVDNSSVSFEISNRTLDARLLASLSTLTICERRRTRKGYLIGIGRRMTAKRGVRANAYVRKYD